jgi:hypothetical protein
MLGTADAAGVATGVGGVSTWCGEQRKVDNCKTAQVESRR